MQKEYNINSEFSCNQKNITSIVNIAEYIQKIYEHIETNDVHDMCF